MKIVDLENQSQVGWVVALDAIVSELLVPYLKGLSSDERQAAIDRMTDHAAGNGKQLVDLAPQAMLGNANKTQAAAARIMKSAIADALTEIGKT